MCLTLGINTAVLAKEITVHNEIYSIDSPGPGLFVFTSHQARPSLPNKPGLTNQMQSIDCSLRTFLASGQPVTWTLLPQQPEHDLPCPSAGAGQGYQQLV